MQDFFESEEVAVGIADAFIGLDGQLAEPFCTGSVAAGRTHAVRGLMIPPGSDERTVYDGEWGDVEVDGARYRVFVPRARTFEDDEFPTGQFYEIVAVRH